MLLLALGIDHNILKVNYHKLCNIGPEFLLISLMNVLGALERPNNIPLVQSSLGRESCLPFNSLSDYDLVVSTSKVDL